MSQRIFASILILSVCPLILLGWISSSAILSEERRAKESLNAYFEQSLSPFVAQSETLLTDLEKELLKEVIAGQRDFERCLGDLRRKSPLVKATFWIAPDGTLLYPEIPQQVDTARAGDIALIHELVRNRPLPLAAETKSRQRPEAVGTKSARQAQAKLIGTPFWMPWYQQQGLQLVLWVPVGEGELAGILLERSAWISRLIASLPDSFSPPLASTQKLISINQTASTRTRLVDSQGLTIYQWGDATSLGDDETEWYLLSNVSLAGPLSPWQLKYESLTPLAVSGTSVVPLVIGLIGIGLLFLLLGMYIATSMRREMRLAAQHVSFAGQVSHELRTPLTNIRLYAEMAIDELTKITGVSLANNVALPQNSDTQAIEPNIDQSLVTVKQRLLVIERETVRLSRLCSSVLELLRQPHNGKVSIRAETQVRHCIEEILDQFTPALEKAEVVVDLAVDPNLTLSVDRDALEMVLVNLMSNIEKYALCGKRLKIWVRVEHEKFVLTVEDSGPGIPHRKRHAVFKPFVRLDNSISAPSGTGIGLSIARQAARRAGGELRLIDQARGSGLPGATFELELPIDENLSSGR